MKIWFAEIGEPLPLEGDVRLHRVGNFSRYLAAKGHDVTWWTSTFVHATKRHVRETDATETIAGVKLRLLKGPGYTRNVSFARFAHQAHFARRLQEESQSTTMPDIVVTSIPTLEVGSTIVKLAQAQDIPVVTDIRDEWPEDFARLAPKPARWIARLALTKYYRMARYICSGSDSIIGISERQLSYGLEMAGRARRATDGVFPLGYTVAPVAPEKVAQAREWWRAQGVTGDRFTVAYFGTIGEFFDLSTVIAATRSVAKDFPIQVILCGDGGSLARYRAEAKDVASVVFPGWIDAPRIAALMAMSHVGLAPYAADAVSMALPNKPFEYMAGGLPIVSSLSGELSRYLAEARCGITYRADVPDELAAALRRLQADPAETKAMGARARRLLDERFTHDRIHHDLEAHLVSLGGRPRVNA